MSDADDIFAPSGRGVTVTLKFGGGFEYPWVVLRGTPDEVKQDIAQIFGFESASVADATIASVIRDAAQEALALGNALAGLGAQPVRRNSGGSKGGSKSQPDEAQADVAAAAAADPLAELKKAIDDAADIDALKVLWAENQEAFQDADLLAAWKAKGQALKSAAS